MGHVLYSLSCFSCVGKGCDASFELAFDYGVSGDDDSVDGGEAPVAPGTNAGAGTLDVVASAKTRATVSGHVILNSCGNLLVRKNDKLTGTRYQRHFLQRVVVKTQGRTVPLLYPEGMLFPSIFWKGAPCGAVVGSIPAPLLAADAKLRANGVASICAHTRCRLTNTSLVAPGNSAYICHAFDSIVNLGCRSSDTRVLIHRGVTPESDGLKVQDKEEAVFDTDNIDSRSVVNKLAAACGEEQATYFYTHTANQKEHFGLSRIKAWIDSDEFLTDDLLFVDDEIDCVEVRERMRAEYKKALADEAAVVLLWNWMETAEIWMTYLFKSHEMPIGDMFQLWWRHEYQSTEGNLSHIHALVWLRKRSKLTKTTFERIRGSTFDLISPDEFQRYAEEGLVASGRESMDEVRSKAEKFLWHVCNRRCKKRVLMQSGGTVLKCRVANTGIENPSPTEHMLKQIDINGCLWGTREAWFGG